MLIASDISLTSSIEPFIFQLPATIALRIAIFHSTLESGRDINFSRPKLQEVIVINQFVCS